MNEPASNAAVRDRQRPVIFNALILRGDWTGVEWASWQRAREFARELPPGSFKCLVARGVDAGLPENCIVRLPAITRSRPGRIFCELFIVPFLVRRIMRDRRFHNAVFYSPAYVAPPFLPCKSALSLYDLHVYTHPQFCTVTNVIHYRLRIPASVRAASVIEAPSRHVADIISRRFPEASGRINVRPPSVRDVFRRPKASSDTATVLGKYGISGRYLLFVGYPSRRKNLPAAVGAWKLLRRQEGLEELDLVVVGASKGTDCLGARSIGRVQDSDMPYLYAGATALVYPSVEEGFGLPLAEAAACGCPAVACFPSASEAAPGVILCEPTPSSIADALLRAVLNNL